MSSQYILNEEILSKTETHIIPINFNKNYFPYERKNTFHDIYSLLCQSWHSIYISFFNLNDIKTL